MVPNEDTAVTISTPIDFWMQYRAARAVVNRTWSTIVGWVFFVGLPILTLVLMICTGKDISAPAMLGLPGWAVPMGGLLFMLILMPLLHALSLLSCRRRNRSVGGVHTYLISLEGFSVSGALFETKLKWDAVLKAVETKRFIFLYVAPRCAHFIPKSAATESDVSTIRSILHEKLGPKARLQHSV